MPGNQNEITHIVLEALEDNSSKAARSSCTWLQDWTVLPGGGVDLGNSDDVAGDELAHEPHLVVQVIGQGDAVVLGKCSCRRGEGHIDHCGTSERSCAAASRTFDRVSSSETRLAVHHPLTAHIGSRLSEEQSGMRALRELAEQPQVPPIDEGLERNECHRRA